MCRCESARNGQDQDSSDRGHRQSRTVIDLVGMSCTAGLANSAVVSYKQCAKRGMGQIVSFTWADFWLSVGLRIPKVVYYFERFGNNYQNPWFIRMKDQAWNRERAGAIWQLEGKAGMDDIEEERDGP